MPPARNVERRRREPERGSGGILPQKILKKWVHLRPHFVRFEDSLLGNKPYKGERIILVHF